MIIACPRCATSYEVEAAGFGRRPRRVQCSACALSWLQQPEAGLALPDAAPAAGTAPPRERTAAADSHADSRASAVDAVTLAEKTVATPIETAFRPAPREASPRLADDPVAPAQEPRQPVAAADVAEAPGDSDNLQPAEAHADDATAGTEPAASAAAATAAAPGRRQPRLPRGPVLVAASVALATLLTLAALLILLREPILTAFPKASRLYAVAGLAPDPLGDGLEIRAVTSSRDRRGGEELLLVSGVVVNISEARAPLPVLQVSLWNDDDLEIRTLLLTDRPSTLPPGQEWAFNATISDPPADTRRIRVGFAGTPAER